MSETETDVNNMVSGTESPCPCLLFTNNKLIHPIQEKVYDLQNLPDRTLDIQLCTANEDWLLFTQHFQYYEVHKAFFLNPFTQATIWLPNILYTTSSLGTRSSLMSMCFTSPPTSPNWKVVVVRRVYSETSRNPIISIETIKCKEDKWTSCEFEFRDNPSFELSFCNPVLHKGLCYLFDKASMLLIHDPKKKTFFLHEAPEYLGMLGREQYMLESDGKLLAVFVATGGSSVLVCRWNLMKKKWEKLKSLGNKVLFVSRPYSISETVSEEGMGNRIYFPRLMRDQCLFYSLDTKRFHTPDGSSFTSLYGSKTVYSSTWIKPSCHSLSGVSSTLVEPDYNDYSHGLNLVFNKSLAL